MTIEAVVNKPLMEELRRKDHVIVPMTTTNSWGAGGWQNNLIRELAHYHGDIWPDMAQIWKKDVGAIDTVESEYIYYHRLVVVDAVEGWRRDEEVNTYEVVRKALDDLYEKYEDEIVRPMRTVPIGFGGMRLKDAAYSVHYKSAVGMLANTMADLALYYWDE